MHLPVSRACKKASASVGQVARLEESECKTKEAASSAVGLVVVAVVVVKNCYCTVESVVVQEALFWQAKDWSKYFQAVVVLLVLVVVVLVVAEYLIALSKDSKAASDD